MKNYEIEKKLLEAAEKRKKRFFELFMDFGDEFYLEAAKEHAEKQRQIEERLQRSLAAKAKPKKERKEKARLEQIIKEAYIEKMAYEMGFESMDICMGTYPKTATAVIGEIIESKLKDEAKLLLIKMFIESKIARDDMDDILSE